jgi:hypothetical protein
MAITLIATPDPPPSTRVIIRRIHAPRDSRSAARPIPPGIGQHERAARPLLRPVTESPAVAGSTPEVAIR